MKAVVRRLSDRNPASFPKGHCDYESCKAFPERCQDVLRLKHGAACEERRSISGAFSLHHHCLNSAMVGPRLAAVDLVPEKVAAVAFIRGDNFKIWKERILLQLGCMDIDYAIRKDEPHKIIDTSTLEEILLYERWEKSNRLSVMYIKTKISVGIRGSIEQHENVRELLKAIDEQFVTSDKALASTLIMKFTSLKLTGIRGVREHIMEMRDIVAQLKKVEIGNDILSSWLATYIGIYTSQDENQDGHDGSYIECYMKEHPGTPIENARCHVMHTISETWKLLNQQCPASNPFSTCFTKACLSVARMVPLMYSYDDNQCLPSLEEHMKSLVEASVSSQSIPPSRITLLKVHL
ncbi:hypothetical protein VitviT2T_014886 [Vitis vinifera]|uniref:Terpene synthase metal-binding domain-containing protein n=1 Tax=Vitis vinifera TaxID=29760 RepID=A0ABY9CNB4_VITVI|nr:hypothetical protein VitviT2T_014886 [Vitis vinifera]